MRDGHDRIDGMLGKLPPRDLARVATESQRRWLEAQLDGVGYDGEDEARSMGNCASVLPATERQLYRSLYEEGAGVRTRASVLVPALAHAGLAFDFSRKAAEGWRTARGMLQLLEQLVPTLTVLDQFATAVQKADGESATTVDADLVTAREALAALPAIIGGLSKAIEARATESESELQQHTETNRELASVGSAFLAEANQARDRLGVDALPVQHRAMLTAALQLLPK